MLITPPATGSLRRAWIPLALSYAIAQPLEVFLHEFSHAVAARALGYQTTIGQFVEDNPAAESGTHEAIIAAAGPVGSVVMGLVFLAIYRRSIRSQSFGNLLLMWLAMTGLVGGIGYLAVMPILADGDTAVLARILGIPMVLQIVIAVGSVGALYFLTRPLSTMYLDTLPPETPLETAFDRARSVTRLWTPFALGFLLLIPAAIGGDPLIVFYGLFGAWGPGMALVGFMTLGARRPYERPVSSGTGSTWHTPAWGYVLYAAVVLFYVLALRPGLPF
ncbi:M50 family metallopeptidase [Planotetraspora mira]|uniref:Uncharacterized protein n=1 Tax=Planotetraspora mira TaxID=58121 RepID=A0A8J3TNR0_9ACTN|nr:M50 family metallopeptidase [Planotetraspora mira]GII28557.1 hypothetical protein Pmi06nite_19990 [Planotetraspora mira]